GIERQRVRLEKALEDWLSLTLGGTAIGTGVGTMPGYTEKLYEILKQDVNPLIRQEANLFDGMQNADSYLYLSGIVKCLAVVLSKICYDLKLMGSGPFAGFGELILPTVQAGSSIMPGKVNPAVPELMVQIAQQICGNDTTITMAVEKGELELNIADQILLKTLLDSI
ncbi:lyase family protein, partial [Turicimonas muris]